MFLKPKEIVERMNLREGDHVADFGCGSGGYLSLLSNAVGRTGKVYALDVQRNMLEKLEREAKKYGYENVEFEVCDVEKKTYLFDNSCDAVLISNILHQTEDVNAVTLEAKRVLKKDGALAIVEWKDHAGNKKIGPHEDHYLSEEKLLAILAKLNLSVKRHMPAGEYHYALLVCGS